LRDRHHAAAGKALQDELAVNSATQAIKNFFRPNILARKLLAVRMMALATRYVVTTQDASSVLTPVPPAM
jgi:hypothetical protein